jgi:hypothetical protein
MKEEHRHVENLKNMTKQEIIIAAPDWFYVADTKHFNIDLGMHKHDRETMTVILNSLMKYWYSWHMSPENFIDAEVLYSLVIPERLDGSLGWENLTEGTFREAVTNNFDTCLFFKELYRRLLVNGHFINEYFITREDMIKGVTVISDCYPEGSFAEVYKLLDEEDMQKYLPDYSFESEVEYRASMKTKA